MATVFKAECSESGIIRMELPPKYIAQAAKAEDFDPYVSVWVTQEAQELAKLPAKAVKAVLYEYGSWSDEELSDAHENLKRLVWLACCDAHTEGEDTVYMDGSYYFNRWK